MPSFKFLQCVPKRSNKQIQSTSSSYFGETHNNNRQIVFCENHFQSNLQIYFYIIQAAFSDVTNDVTEIYK